MIDQFAYDVFLSHSTRDKLAIRQLAVRLKNDGLRVWFDEWIIQPGDMIGQKINEGLRLSRVLVLAMSHHAFESEWATLESGTFLFRDPTNKARRFIPLRLDDAEITDSLRQFAYIDWRSPDDSQYSKLLLACSAGIADHEDEIGAVPTLSKRESKGLGGFQTPIAGIAVTKDVGKIIACSVTGQMQIWDSNLNKLASFHTEHANTVWGVSVSPDGKSALTCSVDTTIRIWDLEDFRLKNVIPTPQRTLWTVQMTPDGQRVVSGSADGSVAVFDYTDGSLVALFIEHDGPVYCVAISSDGTFAVSSSKDGTLRIWDLVNLRCTGILSGHVSAVRSVAITPDSRKIISGGKDGTVRIWNVEKQFLEATLEGHTSNVRTIAISANGKRVISGTESQCRLWNLETGECIACVETSGRGGVAFSQDQAGALTARHNVRMWDLNNIAHFGNALPDTNRYTNAKVLLVGDSGVGKTGLAHRLTENRFKESISTDSAWATQLKLPQEPGNGVLEKEIWLWDFAGQADYRLIHQLYMDETALAVLVFNPQSDNPFEGLGQWDRDLQRAARRPFQKLLVAGRVDRGGLMISKASIEEFRVARNFADYIETSALNGTGCDTLRDAIINRIAWNDIPWTASPRIFKLLKEEIVRLKDEGWVLLRLAELRQQLEMRLSNDSFTSEQLRAVIGLLAGPGVVWQLEFGDFVLLQPERINAYAAAVIRAVRLHVEEIGCIREELVLNGVLDYQDMNRLPSNEEQIVLRAMHQTFVDHGLCLREHTEQGTLLVFPSYFKRERPVLEIHPQVLVTYQFNGPLDEIYATLVVRLHHTPVFERDRLWRLAADYKTPSGKRLGMRMIKRAEGAGEMEVYFDPEISADVKVTFMRYLHDHLTAKAQDVKRCRHYICPHCGEPVENFKAIQTRLDKGLKDIVCVACEGRVPLWDLIEEKFASEDFKKRVREMEELAKSSIDNESRELILEGHARAITGEAGQIYRGYSNSDHGIDGEIEFKDNQGRASGKRLYLQLKSGDSYLYKRQRDGVEIFSITKDRWADYWQDQAYPVMLVIRTSDGNIRWMDVSAYLKRERQGGRKVKQIVFNGEAFSALTLRQLRERILAH